MLQQVMNDQRNIDNDVFLLYTGSILDIYSVGD